MFVITIREPTGRQTHPDPKYQALYVAYRWTASHNKGAGERSCPIIPIQCLRYICVELFLHCPLFVNVEFLNSKQGEEAYYLF
jgi:hypothetical protein